MKEIRDESNEHEINTINRKEIQKDALSALQNLGFKVAEAQSTIDKILTNTIYCISYIFYH